MSILVTLTLFASRSSHNLILTSKPIVNRAANITRANMAVIILTLQAVQWLGSGGLFLCGQKPGVVVLQTSQTTQESDV